MSCRHGRRHIRASRRLQFISYHSRNLSRSHHDAHPHLRLPCGPTSPQARTNEQAWSHSLIHQFTTTETLIDLRATFLFSGTTKTVCGVSSILHQGSASRTYYNLLIRIRHVQLTNGAAARSNTCIFVASGATFICFCFCRAYMCAWYWTTKRLTMLFLREKECLRATGLVKCRSRRCIGIV